MLKKAFSKQNRALLSELVRTDFKLRYQGSVLGYTWSVLKPLFLFAILYIVFVKFLRVGDNVPFFPVYLLFGIVLWTFFAEITNQGLVSVVARGDLIRKIRIPRWIIVLSSTVSALINLIINLVIVIIFMIISRADLLSTTIWLPLIFLEILVFGFGVSLILSALYVKYRDISHIWDVFIQAGFYVTPILYPLTIINNVFFQKLLLMNPMAQAIQDARYMLVTHSSKNLNIGNVFHSSLFYLIPIGLVIAIFFTGVYYFKKEAKNFAENL